MKFLQGFDSQGRLKLDLASDTSQLLSAGQINRAVEATED